MNISHSNYAKKSKNITSKSSHIANSNYSKKQSSNITNVTISGTFKMSGKGGSVLSLINVKKASSVCIFLYVFLFLFLFCFVFYFILCLRKDVVSIQTTLRRV